MALEHKHNLVALLDSQGSKVVCTLIGRTLNILKGKTSFNVLIVNMKHCQLVGIGVGNLINNIKTKVKGIGIFKVDTLKLAFLVLARFYELLAD